MTWIQNEDNAVGFRLQVYLQEYHAKAEQSLQIFYNPWVYSFAIPLQKLLPPIITKFN